jgi:LDH2 family malate/lactate/ureidoglycolate dehydrogenase
MGYINFRYDSLKDFCKKVFRCFGFSKSESAIITDVLLLSDLYGIESHGIQRLVRYHKGIEKGMIKVGAKPKKNVVSTPSKPKESKGTGGSQAVKDRRAAAAADKSLKFVILL